MKNTTISKKYILAASVCVFSMVSSVQVNTAYADEIVFNEKGKWGYRFEP